MKTKTNHQRFQGGIHYVPCYRIRQPRPGDRGAHRSPRAEERQQLVEHAVVGVGAVDAEITVVPGAAVVHRRGQEAEPALGNPPEEAQGS